MNEKFVHAAKVSRILKQASISRGGYRRTAVRGYTPPIEGTVSHQVGNDVHVEWIIDHTKFPVRAADGFIDSTATRERAYQRRANALCEAMLVLEAAGFAVRSEGEGFLIVSAKEVK